MWCHMFVSGRVIQRGATKICVVSCPRLPPWANVVWCHMFVSACAYMDVYLLSLYLFRVWKNCFC